MKQFSTVDECMADLSPQQRQLVDAVRRVILAADASLEEHLKWNAPSYVANGEDRITLNLRRPDQVLVLLHMGATRKEDKTAPPVLSDESGLIEWLSDIRGCLTFSSVAEINQHQSKLTRIIQRWLAIAV